MPLSLSSEEITFGSTYSGFSFVTGQGALGGFDDLRFFEGLGYNDFLFTNSEIEMVVPEKPGNLGQLKKSKSQVVLDKYTLRENVDEVLFYPLNHRYLGHREHVKFNVTAQNLLSVSTAIMNLLNTDTLLLYTTLETELYPTDAEISKFYYIREQIKFKEWLLLADDNIPIYRF